MRVAVIGEGQTEYYCIPTIAGRLGNSVLGQAHIRGSNAGFDWDNLIRKRVVPLVQIMATKLPDKVVVVLDRENRDDCPPELAQRAVEVILAECGYCLGPCIVAVIVCDRQFECLLFADCSAVQSIGILEDSVAAALPTCTDGINILPLIKQHLKVGKSYNKYKHGKQLAQRIMLQDGAVLSRNRSMRKLVKELTTETNIPNLFCE